MKVSFIYFTVDLEYRDVDFQVPLKNMYIYKTSSISEISIFKIKLYFKFIHTRFVYKCTREDFECMLFAPLMPLCLRLTPSYCKNKFHSLRRVCRCNLYFDVGLAYVKERFVHDYGVNR